MTSDPARRRFLERSAQALQRYSGPVRTAPDIPIITSLDIIIDTDRKLGIGGFGKVYEGYWDGQKVAVKVLNETVPESVRSPLENSQRSPF